nr:gibberellin 2-beta-dioxygenase 2-like [Tanacetum cinerariifolium]
MRKCEALYEAGVVRWRLSENVMLDVSSRVNSYVKAVKGIACNILELMAKGIGGVPHSVFTTLLTEHDSDSLLRLNHYPCVTEDHPFQHGNPVGFGEHSDPQILTLLASNGVPGLQVFLGNSRQWVSVAPDPRAFFVIVGDLLQAMTNGRFISVRHRAMANTSSTESRLSMVFFGGPPPHATITCPPQLVKRNKPLVYKPFTWAEYKSHTYAHRLGETRLDHFKLS